MREITDMIFDYYAGECEVDRNEITMSDVVNMFCKVYQYGNDIVNQ